MTTEIHRKLEKGYRAVETVRHEYRELALTVVPLPGETIADLVERASPYLNDPELAVLKMDAFGPVARSRLFTQALTEQCGPVDYPITWLEGAPCGELCMGGLQIQSLAGTAVETVILEGGPVARVFEMGGSRCLLAANVSPSDPAATPPEQARSVLANLEKILAKAEMDMSWVVRTWFYMDNILEWYPDFNRVRTEFYSEKGVFDGLLPASTGIGGSNPRHTALTAGALAFKAGDERTVAREVASPQQCPASEYGSSFSRAMEVISPGLRRVLVSGTASIDAEGNTVNVGDPAGQVAHTMETVAALLATRDLGFEHTSRAVVYCAHPDAAACFETYAAEHGLSDLPVVMIRSTICRPDLLFEIELDCLGIPTADA